MAISEKALENKLQKTCKKYGIKTVKGDSRNNVGFPDRILFNPNTQQIHFIELKNQTYYKQTPPQKKWQEMIERAGGKYFLIDGSEELEKYLNTYVIPNVPSFEDFYGIEDDPEVEQYYRQVMERED